ncbi:hypothetical protein GUJ93_ZPchr0001g29390 [Zizania palustris]|uniref:Uncharacterized protein n=1 Tax=Zizania palustris TaxID=103762 RepID=A0A8J5S433_ZIZPA|nr:hypothetical protein GUJ93_ZPchr0001g29390 [Zizania palustris]
MSLDPLRFLERDQASNEADSEKIVLLMESIQNCRVAPQDCNLASLLRLNTTVAEFEKAVKCVKSYVDQGIFDNLWARCHSAGSVPSAQTMSMRDMFRFKKWITSFAGQAAQRSVQQELKLTRAGKGKYTAEDSALLRLYQTQYDDRARLISREMKERDEKLAKLRRRIERANAKFAAQETVIKEAHPVASGFVPMDPMRLGSVCWDRYIADCAQKNTDPAPKTNTNLSLMVEKFGPDVNQDYLLAHCTVPANRAALLEYGKVKIAGRGEVDDAPPVPEAVVVESSPSRTPAASGEPAGKSASTAVSDESESEEQVPAGDKGKAPAAEEAGERRRPTASTRKKRARKSAKKGAPAKKQRHTDGEE